MRIRSSPGLAVMLLCLSALAAAAPAERLPEFQLPDPSGKAYRDSDFRGQAAIFVISAPTLANEDEQRAWADRLSPWSRAGDTRVAFIQDLEPSWFEEAARERIAEEDRPGREPIVLLDEDGSVRGRFGAPENETVVVLYGPEGKRLQVERGMPSDEALARLRKALD